MAWRSILASIVLLAHVLALVVVSLPVLGMSSAAAMTCDGVARGEDDESAGSSQLPCCSLVCCMGAVIPELVSARVLLVLARPPVSGRNLVTLTVDPGDRPPKA